MRWFVLIFSLLTFKICGAQDFKKLIAEAAFYENNLDDNDALAKYLEANRVKPDNLFVVCQISELYAGIGGRTKDNATLQNDYFNNALEFANKALTINPVSSDANFAMALVMGRTALKKSGKQKIQAVINIKKYTDLAIQYNQSNYKAWFLLGKWYYEISGLNFFERTAAKMFYGELPVASTRQAIDAYNRSMQLNNTFLFNYLSLARAYLRTGNKKKAKDLLNTMLKLPLKTADDTSVKNEGISLLKKL